MKNIIEINNLNFSYDNDNQILNNINIKIAKGSFVSIIGHNGSGKSTIAKVLIGLLKANSGNIYIDDMLLNEDNIYKIRKKIGIVFQNPDNQFIGATIKDDIAFGLENNQISKEEMEKIIVEYVDKVNMLDYLHHEPSKLSGGQKQRVAIAGVLATHPDIIIFDESTSMLDPNGKKIINDLILKLHKEYNLTIISITHDMDQALLSDYIYILNQGSIVKEGKPLDVFNNEKEIISYNLQLPFIIKFIKLLNDNNIKTKNTIEIKEVIKDLCQLKLKI